MIDLKSVIREIPDFPKEGILFYDITTLLINPEALKQSIDTMIERYKGKGITKVLGVESRGFIFAPAVAIGIGAGFVPVRKPGKLPAPTVAAEYELEYGTDKLEMHKDAIEPGDKVIIVDDLIATGGTATAVIDMVKGLGADVMEMAFLVELTFLNPRKKTGDMPIYSMISY